VDQKWPVSVSQIIPGVALQPDARMRCETAASPKEWMVGSVQPAAALVEQRAGGGKIRIDPYLPPPQQRTRRQTKRTRLWNAGCNGFQFDGWQRACHEPRADVGTIEEGFQRAARGAVHAYHNRISPGTDVAHADHLHLDVKARNGENILPIT
jgi:hypothetical protein